MGKVVTLILSCMYTKSKKIVCSKVLEMSLSYNFQSCCTVQDFVFSLRKQTSTTMKFWAFGIGLHSYCVFIFVKIFVYYSDLYSFEKL